MAKGAKKGKKDKNQDSSATAQKNLTSQKKAEIELKILTAFNIFDLSGNHTCQTSEVSTVLRHLNIFASEEQLRTWISKMETIVDEEPSGYVSFDKFLQTVFPILAEDCPVVFDSTVLPLPPLPKVKPKTLEPGYGLPPKEVNETDASAIGETNLPPSVTVGGMSASDAIEINEKPAVAQVVREPKTSFYFKDLNEPLLMQALKLLDKDEKGYLTTDQLKILLLREGDVMSKEEVEDMIMDCTNENKFYFDHYLHLLATSMEH